MLEIKANMAEAFMLKAEADRNLHELEKQLQAIGGALDALKKEEEFAKAEAKAAEDAESAESEAAAKARRQQVAELKKKVAENHKLPPHIIEKQSAQQ